jgi:hypothetical protein
VYEPSGATTSSAANSSAAEAATMAIRFIRQPPGR